MATKNCSMSLGSYLAFFGVAVVLAITPGPDTVLSLRYALHSRREGLLAATGSSLGIFGWAGLAAVGIVAVLRSSEIAYQTLSMLGGSYLLFLGARTLTGVWQSRSGSDVKSATSTRGSSPFWAGLATCLTNPKTGLFFLALFPSFTPADASAWFVFGVLGGTVAAVIFAYLVGIVLLADAANQWLARPRVSQTLNVTIGVLLTGLGANLLGGGILSFF